MRRSIKTLLLSASLIALGTGSGWAQSGYYTGLYGFGDSLTDNGRIPREVNGFSPTGNIDAARGTRLYEGGRWSNAPGYFEQLPARIGVPYEPSTDYAVGGARSVRQDPNPQFSPAFAWGVPDQIDQFTGRTGRFGPRDIALLWIGYNDLTSIPVAGTPDARAAGVSAILANNGTALNRLVGLGAREILVFNQQTFRGNNRDLAASFNAQFPALLQPFSDTGVNVHYFDVDGLLTRLRANPTAFGYSPQAATGNCSADPACAPIGYLNGGAAENQYISVDGVHLTAKTNGYIAAFVANQLNAPLTIGPQADLGQSAGLAFSSTLIDFLSAERRRNMALSVPSAFTADLPGRAPPPVTIPVQPGSPLSVFALGTYLKVDRTAQNRAGGGSLGNTYGADFGGVTAGVLYQATPNLVLGAAFNYLGTSVDLRGRSNGRIDMDSFQGAGFASLSFPNFFADAAVTYGRNTFTLARPGVLGDQLTASPSGDTVTVAARTGYLFDFGTFKAGPVAEVAYANVSVDAYRERGDGLLTIGTRRQDLEGLTAGGGVQIRTVAPIFGGLASPFLNVTAQHDFLDGVRTVTSFQTYAPTLLIRTQTGRRGDDVYGRVAGGLDLDFGNGLSGVLTGSTSFARTGGDDRTVSAGLRYRF
ncbi:autotransporter domain-containing protein [Methylobacterium nonmethylotrophicum]|uniref:Autotransporter domain-containing protein n=1 Tax=Methylobacterium nonmethylotrophicum TaxID=1141884 RepID=A0A4Z0NI17_9HYPH|nr:autotransporter domain-containing protein [Methylobacterium nonmethylotrophicum]TGD95363.1 autotransporter domain-containing protein [Methylobacterium nonmethylotrophicum]